MAFDRSGGGRDQQKSRTEHTSLVKTLVWVIAVVVLLIIGIVALNSIAPVAGDDPGEFHSV